MSNRITIKPISKRARERVRQHGRVMRLLRVDIFQGKKSVLVESLSKSWSLKPGTKTTWSGWFTPQEANWTIHE